jgi:hypothetical protein
VSGAGQDLATGSLTVASTTGFATSGMFSVAGGSGVCSYTGTTSTTFTGITGCTGKPKDTAAVTRIASAPGVYKWSKSASAWQPQIVGIPTGTTMPANPSSGDYFQLTKTAQAQTTVNGGSQDLSLGTLFVNSTVGFGSTGTFKVDGITAACTYTGTTATSFTGITGCTGTPDDKVNVVATASTPAFTAGIYKWNGSSWNFLGDGTAFPDSPAANDYYRLAEHDISASAESGAGGDSGKVSIAGALALNIVSDHTEAIVPGGATVHADGGDVTLKAQSSEENTAKADSDAKSGKVGIGASAAIQVLNAQIIRAAIEDGATFTGGGKFTISANFHHDVETEDKAGSAGGVAISPAVSLAIVSDHTSAYLGTGGAITVTGDVTIQSKEELSSSLEATPRSAPRSLSTS